MEDRARMWRARSRRHRASRGRVLRSLRRSDDSRGPRDPGPSETPGEEVQPLRGRTMKRRIALIALCAALLFGTPAAALGVAIECSSFVGRTVTIAVHNPDPGAKVSVRVIVTVLLVGGSEQTLTSGKVTVPPGATVYVTLTASGTICGIGDDPQPINP